MNDPTESTPPEASAGRPTGSRPLPAGFDPRTPAHVQPSGGRSAGRRRRAATWVAGTMAAAVVLASGGLYGLDRWGNAKLTRIDPFRAGALQQPEKVNLAAQNFLLVGSDGREGMSRTDSARLHVGTTASAAGKRADTMILLHVSEGAEKATMVSFPRDSYVTIPAHTGVDGTRVPAAKGKINSAYASGGPSLAIETVARTTGIHIDHYIEVDFLGFERMVNAVGGVTVCTPKDLRDEKAGLDLAAGTHEIDGELALKFARARYVDNDFGRIDRQQQLLSALLHRATSAGTLTNPVKLTRLVSSVLESVDVDKDLSRGDMIDLAKRLQGLSASKVTFAQIPVVDDRYNPPGPVAEAVLWDQAKAAALFRAIRDDQPIGPKPAASSSAGADGSTGSGAAKVTTPPSEIRVEVLNGAGIDGLAGRAAGDLEQVGFGIAGTGNAPEPTGAKTVIRYDPRWSTSVRTVQAALPGAELVEVTGLGGTFEVVVGSGYRSAVPVTVSKAPAAAAATPAGPASTVATRSAADHAC